MLAQEIRNLVSQVEAQLLTRSTSTTNMRLAGLALLDIASRVEQLERLAIPEAQKLPERIPSHAKVVRLDTRRTRAGQEGGAA